MPCDADPHKEAPGLIMRQKEQENHDQDFYYYVCYGKDKTRHENGFELDRLNNGFGF